MATSKASPFVNAVASGTFSGLVVFVVIVLMDHFAFSGEQTRRLGLTMSLVVAAVLGGAFGAVIGLVLAQTRSMPLAIGAGAVAFAALKVLLAGGFHIVALIVGLIYGAVFGWACASSAAKALESAE